MLYPLTCNRKLTNVKTSERYSKNMGHSANQVIETNQIHQITYVLYLKPSTSDNSPDADTKGD